MSQLTHEDMEQIADRREAAMAEVMALTTRRSSWRMSVPAREDDSDVVISTALRDVPRLLAALGEARRRIPEAG